MLLKGSKAIKEKRKGPFIHLSGLPSFTKGQKLNEINDQVLNGDAEY